LPALMIRARRSVSSAGGSSRAVG